ncbi:hypothetical protein Pcinc_032052 [Petrolisthes cinctipes]|uniref:Uncharacterized protein n=1 Tax=Petrolisthes cinctipes TaxID=88211 RepID=A0AAE1EUW1_PETCI|nr:hypothetical protein Pcinc_032052 [Petrolisthes cinctipes]
MVAVSEQEFRGSRLLPPTARRRAGINHRWAEAEGHEGPRGLVGSGPQQLVFGHKMVGKCNVEQRFNNSLLRRNSDSDTPVIMGGGWDEAKGETSIHYELMVVGAVLVITEGYVGYRKGYLIPT